MITTDSLPTEISLLELAYAEASNALTDYRRRRGLEPGAKVRAQHRDNPPRTGTIAPYGSLWRSINSMCVPVIYDDGGWQPCSLSSLAVLEPAPEKTP
jgi:hypothetical protein